MKKNKAVYKSKEVLQRQKEVEKIRKANPNGVEKDITLREILGRKVRPVEGRDFKRLVKSGALENIEWNGEKSNKSQTYKIG